MIQRKSLDMLKDQYEAAKKATQMLLINSNKTDHQILLALIEQINCYHQDKNGLVVPKNEVAAIKKRLEIMKKVSGADLVLAYLNKDYRSRSYQLFASTILAQKAKNDDFLATLLLARLCSDTNRRQAIILYTKLLLLLENADKLRATGFDGNELNKFTDEAWCFLKDWANKPVNEDDKADSYRNLARWGMVISKSPAVKDIMQQQKECKVTTMTDVVADITLTNRLFCRMLKMQGIDAEKVRTDWETGLAHAYNFSTIEFEYERNKLLLADRFKFEGTLEHKNAPLDFDKFLEKCALRKDELPARMSFAPVVSVGERKEGEIESEGVEYITKPDAPLDKSQLLAHTLFKPQQNSNAPIVVVDKPGADKQDLPVKNKQGAKPQKQVVVMC